MRPKNYISKFFIVTFFLVNWSSFYSQNFNLVGDASSLGGDCYEITRAVDYVAGCIWYVHKIDLTEDFDLQFELNLGSISNGADGMGFVIQTAGPNFLGGYGGGMGFTGIQPSLAVEFDTYENTSSSDPSYDHIAIQRNGNTDHASPNNLAGPVIANPLLPNVKDGNYHKVRITWNAQIKEFKVYFDCLERLSYVGDIVNTIFNGDPEVYWGLTASTGGRQNSHRVCISQSVMHQVDTTEICIGSSTTLVPYITNGTNYSWTPTTGLNNPNIAMPTASPTTSTTYIATFQDDCGFILTDTQYVEVEDFTVDFDFIVKCLNAGVEFSGSANPPSGVASWSWDFGDGTTSNQQNPTHTFNGEGPFTVTLTVTSTKGCSKTISKQVDGFIIIEGGISGSSGDCSSSGPTQVTFTGTGGVAPYTFTYTINGGGSQTVTSTGNSISVDAPTTPGEYLFTLVSVEDSNNPPCLFNSNGTISVNVVVSDLTVNISPDLTICEGDIATLSANAPEALEVFWQFDPTLDDTDVNQAIASPTTTTSYYFHSKFRIGSNLVFNGDFEQGNVGFTSGYIYDSSPPNAPVTGGPGHYAVAPTVGNGWWPNCGDHTTGSGNLLLVDGANNNHDGVPVGADVWCQTINVEPNTDYAFSTWLTNANASGSTSQLAFYINGSQIGNTQATPISPCGWNEFYELWNSGNATTATICLAEVGGNQPGNDFAIDDISFYKVCEKIDTVTVTVRTYPTAIIGGTSGGCDQNDLPEVYFIGENGEAPYTYTYTINNGQNQTIISDDDTVFVSIPTTPGEYTVSLSSIENDGTPSCQTNLSGMNIQVTVPDFSVNISPNQTICEGDSITISANSPEAIEVFWESTTTMIDTNVNQVIVFPQSNTTYYFHSKFRIGSNLVTNGDFEQGNSGFTSDYIFDSNPPNIPTISSPGHYTVSPNITNGWWPNCGDHTTGSGNLLFVDGANGNDGVPTGANVWCQTITVEPNTEYAFSTWLTNANGGGATSEIAFFINGSQIGNTQTTPIDPCGWNEFYSLWNSGNQTTITICIAEMGGEQPGNDFGIDDISFYKICGRVDSVTVYVNPIPSASLDENYSICKDADNPFVLFTGSNGDSPYTFSYSINGGPTQSISTLVGSDTVSLLIPSNQVGTFEYELTEVVDGNSCSQEVSETVVIDINPIPDALFTIENDCVNKTITPIDLSSVTTENNSEIILWSWDFDDGTTSTNPNPTHNYNAEGIYTVQLIVQTNHGCIDTLTQEIEIYPNPSVDFTAESVCIGEETMFEDLSSVSSTYSPNSNVSWSWDLGDGTISSDQNPIHTYVYDGEYQVFLTVTTNNGCESTISKPIHVYPKPTVNFNGSELEGCSPLCPVITSTSAINLPSNMTHYEWILSDGTVYEGSSPVFSDCFETNSADDIYYGLNLKVTSNHGCSSEHYEPDYIKVFHNPIADFYFTPEDPDVLLPLVDFHNTSLFADSYFWNIPNIQTSTNFDLTVEFPFEAAIYQVNLTAITNNGCEDETQQLITIADRVIFYVPNTFTPDSDQMNEIFKPVFSTGYDPYTFSMFIYNRWGEIVFETHDVDRGWDGTYGLKSNQIVPDGTYIWKIDFKETMTDRHRSYTGHANVIR